MATLDQSSEVTIPGPPDKQGNPTSQTMKFGGQGPAVRAHFARFMKARAWSELDQQRGQVDALRFVRLEETIIRLMTAGAYEWGDRIHNEILNEKQGQIAEAVARLRIYRPDADQQTVEMIVDAIGWERLRNLMDQADGPLIPNRKAPAETTGANDQTMNGSSEKSSGDSPDKTRPESPTSQTGKSEAISSQKPSPGQERPEEGAQHTA